MFRTVAFRLTLRYAVLFALLSAAAFGIVYFMLAARLRNRTDEALRDTLTEFTILHQAHGLDALKSEFERESQSKGIGKVFFRLAAQDGKTLISSPLSTWRGLENAPTPTAVAPGGTELRTVSLPGRDFSVRVAWERLPGGAVLQVGQSMRDNEILLERYRETIGWALAAMIAGGTGIGWMLVRRAMAGVERVTQTAIRIGQGDMSRRVDGGREGTEIEHLARAFNEMLERIEALVGEMEDVTTNIAHDLRSPITRIRGMAETTMTAPGGEDAYREMAGTVIEECDRLVGMINTMLEIAQADSGMIALARQPVDLGVMVSRACELFEPLAREKNIRLAAHVPSEPVRVRGDLARLQRVIANLLENALKFTPSGGRVDVRVDEGDAAEARVTVSDTGPGISAETLPHIFERFYRADPSRSTEGNGLGLPLARAIVRAHGGEIEVESSEKGSRFRLTIPH